MAIPAAGDPSSELERWRQSARRIEREIARVIVGQAPVIRLITIAVFARGHVLLQGDVGVGKTTVLRAFARVIGGAFARIEGSVDLMPNDLVYYTYIGQDGRPAIDPGPLLTHGEDLSILFFNEINRARPQVHALLLRAMAERNVRAFNREHPLPHLLVFADRNRLEREETFDISSAALDRFMIEIAMDMPTDRQAQLELIGDSRFHDVDSLIATVAPEVVPHTRLNEAAALIQSHTRTTPELLDYVLELWRATRAPDAAGIVLDRIDAARLMLAGASPRGMSMLVRAARVAAWLEGRDFVAPEDVQRVFGPVISHRLVFQPLYETRRGEIGAALTRAIIERVAAP